MPLFHIHGQVINVLASLVSGASVVASPGFASNPAEIFGWLDPASSSAAPTWYSAVPTMHMSLLEHARSVRSRSGSAPPHKLRLIRNCSAALVPTVGRGLEEVLKVQVMTTYAMTESMPIASNPRSVEGRRLESVGFSGGPSVRVCRENGDTCSVGEVGEVCVQGANVTAGYEYRDHMGGENPNDTAFHERADGKWLRTGDKGVVDGPHGHLRLVGRYKELINRGGEKISPFEVEDVLISHPSVRDLICFAVPHEQLGETVGVAVRLKPGSSVTLTSLRGFGTVGGKLQTKWLPELILTVTDIPKGSTGKPDRIGLSRAWSASKDKGALPALSGNDYQTWDAAEMKTAKDLESVAKQAVDTFVTDEERAIAGSVALEGLPVLSLEGLRAASARLLLPAVCAAAANAIGVEFVEPSCAWMDLGLDSFKFAMLQEKFAQSLGAAVPTKLLTDGITSLGLANFLASQLRFSGTSPLPSATISPPPFIAEGREFELLPIQQAYWLGRQSAFDGARPSWIAWEIEVNTLRVGDFSSAVRELIRRHDALRLAVRPSDEAMARQVVEAHDTDAWDLAVETPPIGADYGEHWESEALESARLRSQRGFGDDRFWRISAVRRSPDPEGAHVLLFCFDLLITDAIGLNVFTRELHALYVGDLLPTGSGHAPSFRQYACALAASRRDRTFGRFLQEEAFWAPRVDEPPPDAENAGTIGLPLCPQLPKSSVRPNDCAPVGMVRHEARLGADARRSLRKLCMRHSITENAMLMSLFASVLATWSSTKHFTIAVAKSFRDGAAVSSMIGQAMDLVLVECDLSVGGSFGAVALRLQRSLTDALEHSKLTSGVELMRRLNVRDGTPGRAVVPFVFASGLGLPHSADRDGTTSMFHWSGRAVPTRTALSTPQVILDFQALPEPDGGVALNFDADASRFVGDCAAVPHQIVSSFVRALEGLASTEVTWSSALQLVPEEQLSMRRAIRSADPTWARALEAAQGLLHEPFLRRVAEHPNSIALVASDGGDAVTYAALLDRAQAYAATILEDGGGGQEPVGVLCPKSIEQIVAVLAVLLAGRAYVPLSVHWPERRLATIASKVRMRTCLVAQSCKRPAMPKGVRCVKVDASPAGNAGRRRGSAGGPRRGKDDDAYIIFTSGSTGEPKGVLIPHRGSSNTCLDMCKLFDVGSDDKVVALAELTFDLSVFDIFGMLGVGGTVILPCDLRSSDPSHILDLLEKHKVTIWNTAPPVMALLLDYCLQLPDELRRFRGLHLRRIFLSGDYIQLTTPPQLYKLLANPELEVVSLGGATEASIWSNFFRIPRELDPAWATIPYGFPLTNQALFVLDDDGLAPVPDRVVGEICIAGHGLAKGYWREDDKTRAVFVYSAALGLNVYRTGDLGRFMADGAVEFLGRKDFQVKINGYRVELGEVQRACAASEMVDEAMVLAVGKKGSIALVAFLRPAKGAQDEAATKDDATRLCIERLPTYMHPSSYHSLSPELLKSVLTPNGKLDRKRLLEEHRRRLSASARQQPGQAVAAAPRDEFERRLVEIVEAVVCEPDDEPLGVFVSLADLGIDSIQSTRIATRIQKAFGIAIGVSDVLGGSSTTVASLAAQLRLGAGPQLRRHPGMIDFGGHGPLPPLFLIAPVSGNGQVYTKLARLLAPQQAVYALSCPGLDGDTHEAPLTSVEAIAAHLLQTVASVVGRHHAESGFHLGGWSFGGVVAFEMSRQAPTDDSLSCHSVILIDSPAPFAFPHTKTNDHRSAVLASFALDFRLSKQTGALKAAAVAAPSSTRASTFQDEAALLTELQAEGVVSTEVTASNFARMVEVYAANLRALSNYRPSAEALRQRPPRATAHDGEILLLRATETKAPHLRAAYPEAASRSDFGWTVVAGLDPSRVRLRHYRGTHYGPTQTGPVQRIAELMREALRLQAPLPASAVSAKPQGGRVWRKVNAAHKAAVLMRLATNVESSERTTRYTHVVSPSHGSGGRDGFRLATGWSADLDTQRAASEAIARLRRALGGSTPQLVVVGVSSGVHGDPAAVVRALRSVPGASLDDCAIHLSSSLHGGVCKWPSLHLLHATAAHSGADHKRARAAPRPSPAGEDGLKPLVVLGIRDPGGSFGIGSSSALAMRTEVGTATAASEATALAAFGAGASAASSAFRASDPPELPALAIVSSTRGDEESVLAGVRCVLPGVPVIGGSAADDGVLDPKLCFVAASASASSRGQPKTSGDEVKVFRRKGVVVSLLWPSVPFSLTFSNPFKPTAARGVVTAAAGRVLKEIDGRPAAEVYCNEWAQSAELRAALAAAPSNVLSCATLRPLARMVRAPLDHNEDGNAVFRSLIHPEAILEDGKSIRLFADVNVGDERVNALTCMRASVEELDAHTELVLDGAPPIEHHLGALLIYCGGCALALGDDRLEAVSKRLHRSLRDQPFLGLLTYGEHCVDEFGDARFANLMYAMLQFHHQ